MVLCSEFGRYQNSLNSPQDNINPNNVRRLILSVFVVVVVLISLSLSSVCELCVVFTYSLFGNFLLSCDYDLFAGLSFVSPAAFARPFASCVFEQIRR